MKFSRAYNKVLMNDKLLMISNCNCQEIKHLGKIKSHDLFDFMSQITAY